MRLYIWTQRQTSGKIESSHCAMQEEEKSASER